MTQIYAVETAPDAQTTVQAQVKRNRAQRLVVMLALLVPLLAVAIYLVVSFSPFANAAGGCGGG